MQTINTTCMQLMQAVENAETDKTTELLKNSQLITSISILCFPFIQLDKLQFIVFQPGNAQLRLYCHVIPLTLQMLRNV